MRKLIHIARRIYPERRRLNAAIVAVLLAWMSYPAQADMVELGRGADINEANFVLGELGTRLLNQDQFDFSQPRDMRIPEQPSAREFAKMLNDGLINPSFPVRSILTYSDESTIFEVEALLERPLCIIGADDGSLDWLEKNKALLIERQALCAIADADDQSQLERIQAVAAPVPVFAIPLDDIARIHAIRHYPVLVIGNTLPRTNQQ